MCTLDGLNAEHKFEYGSPYLAVCHFTFTLLSAVHTINCCNSHPLFRKQDIRCPVNIENVTMDTHRDATQLMFTSSHVSSNLDMTKWWLCLQGEGVSVHFHNFDPFRLICVIVNRRGGCFHIAWFSTNHCLILHKFSSVFCIIYYFIFLISVLFLFYFNFIVFSHPHF